jgi:hypothetical protein
MQSQKKLTKRMLSFSNPPEIVFDESDMGYWGCSVQPFLLFTHAQRAVFVSAASLCTRAIASALDTYPIWVINTPYGVLYKAAFGSLHAG